ncbi:glutathione S transferase D8-like, partial [Planoprotostelium fungivorum]
LSFTLEMPPGGLKSKEHLSLNRRGQIPILKDGDVVVNESIAQMIYLDAHHEGTKQLTPKEKSQHAIFLARLMEVNNLTMAYGPIMFKGLFGQGQTTREQVLMLMGELNIWNSYAEQSEWLAGQDISLVDIAAFPSIAGCIFIGIQLEKTYPSLYKWYAKMCERDSVKNTWPFKDMYSRPHSVPAITSLYQSL